MEVWKARNVFQSGDKVAAQIQVGEVMQFGQTLDHFYLVILQEQAFQFYQMAETKDQIKHEWEYHHNAHNTVFTSIGYYKSSSCRNTILLSKSQL